MFLYARFLADTLYGQGYLTPSQAVSVPGKKEIIGFLRRALIYPFIQELFYLLMKRDVSVVMHLSQWYAKPVVFADLDHAISGKVKEFTLAHAGQYQSNSTEPCKQVRMISGRL